MEIRKIFGRRRLGIIFLLWLVNCFCYYKTYDGVKESEINDYYDSQREYSERYQNEIQEVIDASETILASDLMRNSRAFVENNLLKTRYDFIRLKNIQTGSAHTFGFTKAYDYNLGIFFGIASALVIISSFAEEKNNGFFLILHSSKNGRYNLALRRFLILLFSSVFIAALYEISIYAVGAEMFHDSLGDYLKPVQSIPGFGQCILHINLIEMIMLCIFADIIIIMLFCMLFWLLTEIILKKNIIILCFLGIAAAEMLLYNIIRSRSVFNILKYCNIFAVFNLKQYLFTYSNYGIFNFITETYVIILIFAAAGILLLLTLLLLKYNRSDTSVRQLKLISKAENYIGRFKEKILGVLPLVLTEVYKQFSVQHGLFVMVVAVFMFFQSRPDTGAAHNEVQAELEKYYNEAAYAENQEEFTEEYLNKTEQWLINAENELEVYEADNNVYQVKILSREINLQRQVKNEIANQKQYRQELRQRGIACGIVAQQEFQTIIGGEMYSYEEKNALIAVAAVIITAYGIVSYEKKTHMTGLIKSSKIGYKRYLAKKLYSLIIITFIFWIIIYGLNFINLIKVYGINIRDLRYPIQSIMTMQTYHLNISIGAFFLIKNLLRFILMLAASLIGFFISVKTSYKNGVFLCALIFAPYILNLMGIHIMKYLSVFYWMTIC